MALSLTTISGTILSLGLGIVSRHALVYPSSFTGQFGIHPVPSSVDPSTRSLIESLIQIQGGQLLSLGAILLVFWVRNQRRELGLTMLCCSLSALVDGYVCLKSARVRRDYFTLLPLQFYVVTANFVLLGSYLTFW